MMGGLNGNYRYEPFLVINGAINPALSGIGMISRILAGYIPPGGDIGGRFMDTQV